MTTGEQEGGGEGWVGRVRGGDARSASVVTRGLVAARAGPLAGWRCSATRALGARSNPGVPLTGFQILSRPSYLTLYPTPFSFTGI